MTGWRIGFAVGNAEAIKAIAKIKSNIDTDIFKPIQLAAIAGLTGPTDHIDYCNKLYLSAATSLSSVSLNWVPVKPIKATLHVVACSSRYDFS